jgi:hypothetical protein
MMTYDLNKLAEVNQTASLRLYGLTTIAYEFLPEITGISLDDKQALFDSLPPLVDFLSTKETEYPYLAYHIYLLCFHLEENSTQQ